MHCELRTAGFTLRFVKRTVRFSASSGRASPAIKKASEAVYQCANLDSLQESYREAMDELTKNSKKLRAATDATATEYALVSNLAKRSRVKAETAAQRLLQQHISEHHC